MSPHPKVYDALILGSSPVLLIEASLRAQLGQKVALVEASPDLGGCWQHTTLGPIGRVEGACHLLENYRGAYSLLEELTGLTTSPCEPQPIVLERSGQRIPYHARRRTLARAAALAWRFPVAAAAKALRAWTGGRLGSARAAGFDFGTAWRQLCALARHPWLHRDRAAAIRYVDGGSPSLLARWTAQLHAYEVDVIRGSLRSLDLDDHLIGCRLEDGTAMRTSEVVVADAARIPTLRRGGADQHFATTRTVHRHLLWEVEGLAADHLSYVQLPRDPLIPRVSDVTAFCTDVPPGHRVLVVQLTDSVAAGDLDSQSQTALAYLERRDVLPAGLRIAAARHFEIAGSAPCPELRQAFRDAGDERLHWLPSHGDLSLALLNNRERWTRLCDRRPGERICAAAPAGRPFARTGQPISLF